MTLMEATSEEQLQEPYHSEDRLTLLSCCKDENSTTEFLTLQFRKLRRENIEGNKQE